MANARSGGVLRAFRTLFGPGTAMGLSDAQLLDRFAARRAEASVAADAAEAAFEALVARHGPMVLGVCRRALTDPNDIEDAFQATFLVLVRRANTIRVGDSLGGWLHGVARRVAAKARNRSKQRRIPSTGCRTEHDISGFDPALAELHAALDEEIGRLPGKFRDPLVICHLEGLSHAEAARRLGWPIGTVSGRLSQARGLLRERLARRGFSLAIGPLAALLDPRAARATMPEALARSTCCAAVRLAINGVATAGIPPVVALDLVELVLREIAMSKVKAAAVVLTVLGTIAIASGAWAQNRPQDPEHNPHKVPELNTVAPAPAARRDQQREADRPTIQFPADRAIGVLYTRPGDAQDWPGGDWERLGEAIGEVAIPAGRQVRLELGAGSRADLSPLKKLRPDDLRSLHVRDADLRGDALAPLANLTGLEEANLLNCPIGDEGARHLAGLPRLKSLALGGCQVGDEGLARLAALRSLERLDLGSCWFTEAGLAHVGGMKTLKSLSLYRSDIVDGGLARLKDLSALEALRLADCLHISDAGLAHLAGLPRLKRLDLESTPITDAGLAHLAGLGSLEDLNLPDTRITDAGLVHLRGLRSLRRLSLPQGMSDECLAHVGALRSLRDLTVRPGRVTDRGIASLSTLDQLQVLNLGSGSRAANVTDAAAVHLARLPALKKLWLQHTGIGDDGLEALTRSQSLEWLYLNGNRVTSEGLRHLSSFRTLTYLALSGIRGPAGSLRHLRPLKGLTGLSIDGSGWLDPGGDGDVELAHLSGLTRLESLTLKLPLDDAGMRHLAGLTSLRWLEADDKNNRLTDDGLACVSGMKGLTHLRVSGWITDRGLEHVEDLRSLYYLNLGSRPGAISDEAAAALKVRNPSIRVMHYPRRRTNDPPPPAIGQDAPEIEAEAFDGRKVRLSELKGKVVLLHFWATWCTPCLEETPRLKAFIEGCRGKGDSFEAISLSLDEDAHWAKRHAQRNGLSWPQAWVGASSAACSAYAVNSAPHYVVIRPDGKVAYAGRELDAAREAANGALERPLPNDPMLSEQWYLYPPGDERGGPGGINAIEAWRHIRPAKPIVVAVLDTGVNYTHPDLEANIWTNEQETRNGKDDDNNGYADDLHGWDFVNADNDPIGYPSRKFPDQFDHGTAVASLIAAVADNGVGIVGVGRNVEIMPLRILGEPGDGNELHTGPRTTLPQAIRYAIRNGARVIVCTFYPMRESPERPAEDSFEALLRETEKAGVLFVRAAGNQGRNIDDDKDFQCLAPFSNVLVVGGTIRDGTLSPRMNFGKRVGIAAPSVDMVFPSFDGYVRFKGPGTSFAAPIVAAVAASLLSQEPDLTPAQVIARLREASVLAPGMEGVIGGGRLDMAKLFAP